MFCQMFGPLTFEVQTIIDRLGRQPGVHSTALCRSLELRMVRRARSPEWQSTNITKSPEHAEQHDILFTNVKQKVH